MPPTVDPVTPMVEVPQIPLPLQAGQGLGNQGSASQGPETVTLSEEKAGTQGNWMKKNEYLLKSNDLFDLIQNMVLEIQGSRKSFNQKYHAIDEEFDNFYLNGSIDQGKLQELFESLDRYIEKKKKKRLEELSTNANKKEEPSGLAPNDYQFKVISIDSEIKRNKDDLEQLKLDLKSIDELDKSIVDRLRRVDEQMAQAKDLFDKAKISIEELWDIIDDKKARAIFYELQLSTVEKIKNINSYLKEDLARDFDTVIETARSQMNKVKEAIKKLEEAGMIIKDRSKRIEQIKLEQKQKELAKQAAAKIKTKEEVIDLKKIKKQPTLWYEKIYDYIITTISKTYHYLKSFLGPDIKPIGKTPSPSGQTSPRSALPSNPSKAPVI